MRFLTARGRLAVGALAALLGAGAIHAVAARPSPPPTLDHPWSYAP